MRHTWEPASPRAASPSHARKPSRGSESRARPAAQPDLVGSQQQHGAGPRLLGQPPQPLGEGGPVGGVALAHHGEAASVGQDYSRVRRPGPVPVESDREGGFGESCGDAVDDGHCVQAFQRDATPAGGNGPGYEELVDVDALVVGQPAQTLGGETVAGGGGNQS